MPEPSHDTPPARDSLWSANQRESLAGVQSAGELVSLLRVHQRQCWQQGKRVRVEDYLADFPLLATDSQAVVDLVFDEMQLRQEAGAPAALDEYLQRLPAYAGSIEMRYSLHQLLAGGPAPGDTGHDRPATVCGPVKTPPVPPVKVPHLPRYDILRELGRGGMGVVYLARQEGLDRLVALKMVLSGVHASPQELARFRAEAVAISRLQHPNLVQIHEVGEHDGLPYFSMEYLSGGNLADQIGGKPQKPIQAAELIRTLALAVHCAHQHDIVHRDLKPANVLMEMEVVADGAASLAIPKISDFGLAKNIEASDDQTRTGAILGTPSYMAPEQAAGKNKEVGPAADIYALGAILYELLTGRPPFLSDSSWDTLFQVIHQESVPPSHLQPKVPGDLETICLKCLDKAPGKRYASALHLADDLQRFLENRPIQARPVGAVERTVKWVKRHPAAAALLFVSFLGLVLFVAGAIWHHVYLHEALDEAQEARQLSNDRLIHLFIHTGVRTGDRGYLLRSLPWFVEAMREDVAVERQDMHRLRLTTILHECPRLEQMLFQDGTVIQAEFSPDESQIVTVSGSTVQVWNAATGAPLGPPLHHGDEVEHVAFSPDGRWLVSASRDRTGWVWEASTGLKRFTVPLRHQGAMNWAAFSPDGQRIVTSGAGGVAKVWDAATGKPLLELKHDREVRSALFNPAGDRLLTACNDGTAQLWDAGTGKRDGPPLQHAKAVHFATFSPDGRWAATASADGTARVWSAATGQPVSPPLSHLGPVRSVAFSPDSRQIATAGMDGAARLWEAEAGKLLAIMTHDSIVHTVVFSRDGKWLVTASDDNTACVWDTERGTRLGSPLWHNGSLHSARFSADGRRVLTASGSGVTRVWEVGRRIPGATVQHKGPVTTACFSPNGQVLLTASEDGRAQLWEAESGKPIGAPLEHDGPVSSAVFSADGRQVVTGSRDRMARVWDTATQRPLTPPLVHLGRVRAVDFSPDGRRVASASDDGTAQVWNARTGQPIGSPLRHPRPVLGAAFSPDGRLLLTACADGMARLWDLDGVGKLRHGLRHEGGVYHAAFSPDGRRVVTASDDRTARVWDVASGQAVSPPLAHSSLVNQASFSPDGRLVVTAGDDNSARVWDAATGQPHAPPMWHWGSVLQAKFSPDGQFVLTASADRTARLWNKDNGNPVTALLRHNLPVTDACFRPDGLQLLTASADGTARVWDLTLDPRPVAELMLICELLAGGWIDETGGFVPSQQHVLKKHWQEYCRQHRNPAK